MSKLFPVLFDNHQVRIIDDKGGFWFVAKDVAAILGYNNKAKAIRMHCKGVSETDIPTKGGKQIVKIIPESDLYTLILHSRKTEAKKFKAWITKEVLPTIRRTGRYEIRTPIVKEQLTLPFQKSVPQNHDTSSRDVLIDTALALNELTANLLKQLKIA